ncbi:MAG: AMP-binding protein [Paludibacteraceae bacterium]|nr:AMP-binding protein [Paludibacteraceae bacterium]
MSKRFIQYLESPFKKNWEDLCMVDHASKRTYAYKDVAQRIAMMQILFKKLDITQTDKIAIVGPNSQDWSMTLLSIVTYGAVAVPIQEDFHPEVIEEIIIHSESKILFITESNLERLNKERLSGLEYVLSLSDLESIRLLTPGKQAVDMSEIQTIYKETYPNGLSREDINFTDKDDKEVAVIIYTSGTSGFTKGVMLTGEGFACVLDFLQDMGEKGDKVISFLPLAHTYALMYDLFLPIMNGLVIVYLNKVPSIKVLMSAIQEVKPDWITTVPLFVETTYKKAVVPYFSKRYRRILFHIPLISNIMGSVLKRKMIDVFGGKMKQLGVGGAGLSHEVEAFFEKIKFPYVVGYGMTECSPLISADYHHYRSYSVGKVIPNVSVRIDSSNPTSVPGEILVKGLNLMKGYYRDEEATKQVFTEDGWFKTGDVGLFDSDGYLYIKGKTKNMLLTSSGQNVYPEEIEAKLNSDPIVEDSLVVLRDGKKLVALVYPSYPTIGENVDPKALAEMMETLRKKVNRNLASYEYLSSVEIMAEPFEKTAKKSIKRYLYQ